MSSIGQASLQIPDTLFRSLLPRNQPLRIPDSNRRDRRHPESSALRLIGHFETTSIVFLALTACVWVASLILHVVQFIFPFSDEMLAPLQKLELFALYADVIATGITLLNALVRYIVALLRGHS